MHLIVGLGNPGAEYANNRHNVGFMAADAIARRHSLSPWRSKFNGLLTDGQVGDSRVLLLKPETFMNRSGDSVGAAMKFYKLGLDDISVIYDELDLAPGKVRVKTGGGSGGHNGIRSIEAHVGNAFRRVRVGIGHPGHKELVHRHVLGDFAKSDAEWLDPMLDAIADNAELLARGDAANFMNRIANETASATAPTPKTPKAAEPASAEPASEPARSDEGPMAGMLKRLFGGRGQ